MRADANSIDVSKHVLDFQNKRELYVAFTDKLKTLIVELLLGQNIKPQTIEARTKTVESFREKIQRPNKAYKNPLQELTDLCGLRVILYTQEDVARVCQLIENEFSVDVKNSLDKRKELRTNEFGYLSVHKIVSLNCERVILSEYKNYETLRAEIQVRTVLQHAWAAVDHRLRYKSETDAPEHLRRRLFLLSGLFEMADREFSELVQSSEQYVSEVEEQIAQKNLAIPIDTHSLRSYIKDSKVARRIIEQARSVGYTELKLQERFNKVLYYDLHYYDELDDDMLSDSVFYCGLAGIMNLIELEENLIKKLPYYNEYFALCKEVLSPKERTDTYVFSVALWLITKEHITVENLVERNWWRPSAALIVEFLNKIPS